MAMTESETITETKDSQYKAGSLLSTAARSYGVHYFSVCLAFKGKASIERK